MQATSDTSSSDPWAPHAAPGELRILQDLVNSRQLETGRDELTGPEELAAWLSRHELLPADTPLTEADWRCALAIREGLRALFRKHSGESLERGAIEALNRAFSDVHQQLRFAPDASLHLEPAEPGWAGGRGRLLLMIFRAMSENKWHRFKLCRNEECQLAFYDGSTNRRGRWCSVRRCGNKINLRAHRRRKPRRRWR